MGNIFATTIQSEFEKHRSDYDAQRMSAYMKNKFPFLGIKSPLRNELSKEFLKIKCQDANELVEIVDALWQLDEREYQYVALEYLHSQRKMLTIEHILFLERLITTKSWWDTVDNLASKAVGLLLLRFPDETPQVIRPWIHSDNLWLNRSAIIFQLKYKGNVDLQLLTEAIEAHSESKEFFHAKAIGWALRQYSKFNKDWVKTFIGEHYLQPLSIKEGSKYL